MRQILQVISWFACAATILPSLMFLAGVVSLEQMKWTMLVATLAWFLATPLWMGRSPAEPAA